VLRGTFRHGWNRINGLYFDITHELIIGNKILNPNNREYYMTSEILSSNEEEILKKVIEWDDDIY
jgi:hypothetical protein